jgi:hypothetical protein
MTIDWYSNDIPTFTYEAAILFGLRRRTNTLKTNVKSSLNKDVNKPLNANISPAAINDGSTPHIRDKVPPQPQKLQISESESSSNATKQSYQAKARQPANIPAFKAKEFVKETPPAPRPLMLTIENLSNLGKTVHKPLPVPEPQTLDTQQYSEDESNPTPKANTSLEPTDRPISPTPSVFSVTTADTYGSRIPQSVHESPLEPHSALGTRPPGKMSFNRLFAQVFSLHEEFKYPLPERYRGQQLPRYFNSKRKLHELVKYTSKRERQSDFANLCSFYDEDLTMIQFVNNYSDKVLNPKGYPSFLLTEYEAELGLLTPKDLDINESLFHSILRRLKIGDPYDNPAVSLYFRLILEFIRASHDARKLKRSKSSDYEMFSDTCLFITNEARKLSSADLLKFHETGTLRATYAIFGTSCKYPDSPSAGTQIPVPGFEKGDFFEASSLTKVTSSLLSFVHHFFTISNPSEI